MTIPGWVEVNEKIQEKPELVNSDCYGKGWVAVIKPTNLEENLPNLISGADAIRAWVEQDIKERLK